MTLSRLLEEPNTGAVEFKRLSDLGLAAQPGMASAGSASPQVFVAADSAGIVGGAARATLLLCEGLAGLDLRVRLFVAHAPDRSAQGRLRAARVPWTTPRISVGWRWDMPRRALVRHVVAAAQRERPRFIQCVGINEQVSRLLRHPEIPPLLLWETTEALPGLKFTNPHIPLPPDRVAAVMVPSTVIGRNVRRTYNYSGPLIRLPFWVDPAPRVQPRQPRVRGRVGYVGRLDEDKGIDVLIRAFRGLGSADSKFRLLVRGAGDPSRIRAMANGHPGIIVGGYLDELEFERFMEDLDVFVLPSRHEGYPLTVLEACARGIPVVATNVGSVPEMFQSSRAAIQVQPGDAEALAIAIQECLTESDAAHETRRADARRVYDSLSSPKVVADLLYSAYIQATPR